MPERLRAGPFRGLAPYMEEDETLFFGRDRERAELVKHVSGDDGPTALLIGEPGVGKTSLLRAGLIPGLPAGRSSMFINCRRRWEEDLSGELSRLLKHPVDLEEQLADPVEDALSEAGGLVLILDHLEQLTWLADDGIQRLGELCNRVLKAEGKLVMSVDRGNMHTVERLSALVPEALECRRIQLGRMDRETASQVMEQTVLSGGGYMEAGLPELIAEELTAAGPILPASLQVVGFAAISQGATGLKRYSRAGGALALSNLFVEHLTARAGAWRARRALAMLSNNSNPRFTSPVGPIARYCGLNVRATRKVLDALEREGLVQNKADPRFVESKPCFAIIHPYLMQSIKDTVAPVHRGRAMARLSLRRRIHGRGVLRPDEIVRVWRYLGTSVSNEEWDQVRRGTKIWSMVAAGLLALPLLVSLGLYLSLSSSAFVATAEGLPGMARVVVRTGDPSLRFAFNMTTKPFGLVMLDTGLILATLPDGLRKKVVTGGVVGDRDHRGSGLPFWMEQLVQSMPRVRRGALLILAGDGRAGSALLEKAAASDKDREKATWALALLSGDSAPTQAALLHCMKDPRAEVRRMAVAEARRLKFKNAMKVLGLALKDRDSHIRLAALEALDRASEAQLLDLLKGRLGEADPRVLGELIKHLSRAAKVHPVKVFVRARRALERARRSDVPATRIYEPLLKRIQRQAPRKIAAHLMTVATSGKSVPVKVEALKRLVVISKGLKAAGIMKGVDKLVSHEDPQIRAAAITLEARFAEPEQALKQLSRLAYMVHPRRESAIMRRAAAVGLGLVRQRPDKERMKLLRRLLQDPAPGVRSAAMESLVALGVPGLREVVRGIKNGPPDVVLAALRAVCSVAQPDRRVATTVLATSWKRKRSDVRAEALRCARRLVAANPRLSMWLADNARLDRNPEVRRSAADAVALAVTRGGARAEFLTRFYLRQGDASIVVAVLTSMGSTIKRPAAFVLKEVSRLVGHRDAGVRAATARLLVIMAPGDPQTITSLNALLKDPSPRVVKAALSAAIRLTPGAPVQPMDATLARVVSAARSKQALFALKVARTLKLSTPLLRAAVHPEPDVRAAALELLARSSDRKKTRDALAAARLDPEPVLRLAALRAIADQSGRLGASTVTLLSLSTTSASPAERWAAFEALGKVHGAGINPAVRFLVQLGDHRSEERRRLAMRALGSLAPRSEKAAHALIHGSLDPAVDVRTEAQGVLAEYLGRHCPRKVLWELLRGAEHDALQRHTMISALAWSGRLHGVAGLKQLVEGMERETPLVTRVAARLALALARRSDRPEGVVSWLFGW